MQTYIGIDNGCSGSIGIINDSGYFFYKTPTKSEQSYTKAKKNITRIDVKALTVLLEPHRGDIRMVLVERPMVNPGRFNATISAIRALEATLVVLEGLGLPKAYLDSKAWQKELLPSGCSGEELKKASLDIGNRMFLNLNIKHDDRDGILIAEYCRRLYK